MGKTGFWFLVVGCTAAAVHMAVFHLAQTHMWPELANALGFGVAFFTSFFGHRHLSFQDSATSTATSFWRFLLTALSGFISNEIVFTLLFRALHLPSLWALVLGMVFAAGQSFVLGRYWAFKR